MGRAPGPSPAALSVLHGQDGDPPKDRRDRRDSPIWSLCVLLETRGACSHQGSFCGPARWAV